MRQTTKKVLGLTDKQVEKVIKDFLEHLFVAGIALYDEEDEYIFSDDFILENYMATFE